jgi:hypothetical protein
MALVFPQLESVHKHSYRNFHKEGFDYVCLQRTEAFTLKAYFFDQRHEDIVMPHDHRYDFTSTVLRGILINRRYGEWSKGSVGGLKNPVNKFEYLTPLNGGSGFSFLEEVDLHHIEDNIHRTGSTCHSHSTDVHTISVTKGTVLLLTQFADKIPLNKPTYAYRFDSKEPPSLKGLYEKFTEAQLVNRLVELEKLGIRL